MLSFVRLVVSLTRIRFYFGYNVLALIRVRWPNKGLSEGVRNPCFSGNCDERAKRGCVLSEFIIFVEYLDFQMNSLSTTLSHLVRSSSLMKVIA